MDDISSQNQANLKVPKDTVQKFVSGQKQTTTNQPKPDSISSAESLQSLQQKSSVFPDSNLQTKSEPEPRINIIKSQELAQKPQDQIPQKQGVDAIRDQIKSTADIKSQQQTIPEQKTRISPATPTQDIPQSKAQIDTKGLMSTIIKYVIIIIIALALGYIIVNWSSLALKINYWQNSSTWQQEHLIELQGAKTTAQKFDENYLYIEALGIQAPVSWGVENHDIKSMLSQGLVNYATGALPDDSVGEIFITGQTSGPIWSGSSYKTVFTLLNKIKNTDKIMLIYKNKIYTYQVENTYSQFGGIETLPGNPDTSYLNLLAKYPLGIGWSTFVVSAKLTAIADNVPSSMDDKTKAGNSTDLDPNTITPTPTTTPIPTSTSLYDDSTAPQVFLPDL